MNQFLKNIIVTVIFVLIGSTAMAQKFATHAVKKGETIESISKQYKVSPSDILKLNKEIKQEDYIDNVYYKALHKPHSSLEEEQAELIWKLLIKMQPIDPLHLYWYDKAQFYEAYQTWPDTYQDWVIQAILEENE